MILGGLQKTTLVDYPNRVACAVFTVGCNFFCPYCHNKDLVSRKRFAQSSLVEIKEKDFFEFLNKRQKILDGVCLTGGEPTLQPDLISFCRKIKDLGFLLKIDTNGGRPEVLEALIRGKLLDFVALDIKSNKENYALMTEISYEKVAQSLGLVITSGLDYQLRTTLAPTIHNKKNLVILAEEIKDLTLENGGDPNNLVWRLQKFLPQNCLKAKFNNLSPFSSQKLESLLLAAQSILPKTSGDF